jgi:hypothetical protein
LDLQFRLVAEFTGSTWRKKEKFPGFGARTLMSLEMRLLCHPGEGGAGAADTAKVLLGAEIWLDAAGFAAGADQAPSGGLL